MSHKTHRPHVKVGKDAEEEDYGIQHKHDCVLDSNMSSFISLVNIIANYSIKS